ncbi:MAG: hypothetical protein IRZ04_09345 [Rhodospirillales bacterium]|nr:hypothetical protein [Rhodospirillales bacterium]
MVQLGPAFESPAASRGSATRNGAAGIVMAAMMAVVALAPLAPRLPAGEALACGALGIVALAAGVLGIAGRLGPAVPPSRLVPAVAGFACLAFIAAVQALLPLPPGWAPLWDEAGAALPGAAVVPRLSFDPGATLEALLRLLAGGAAFWSALQLGRGAARARQTISALVVLAAIEAAAFLVGAHPSPTLAGAGLGGALVLVFDVMAEAGASGRSFGPALSRFVERFATDGLPTLGAILFLAASVIVEGAALGAVAAGALVTLLGLAAAPSLAVLRRRGLLALWAPLFAGALAAVGFALSNGAVSSFVRGDDPALFALLDYPLTGVGLGAIEAAMPLYRETQGSAAAPLPSALALAVGAGIPGALALGSAVLFLAGRSAVGLWRRRRNAAFPAAALGAAIAAALSPAPPLAALLGWAVLLGVGTAQSFRTREA